MLTRRGFLKGAFAAAAGLVGFKFAQSQPTEIGVRSHPTPILDNMGIQASSVAEAMGKASAMVDLNDVAAAPGKTSAMIDFWGGVFDLEAGRFDGPARINDHVYFYDGYYHAYPRDIVPLKPGCNFVGCVVAIQESSRHHTTIKVSMPHKQVVYRDVYDPEGTGIEYCEDSGWWEEDDDSGS